MLPIAPYLMNLMFPEKLQNMDKSKLGHDMLRKTEFAVVDVEKDLANSSNN